MISSHSMPCNVLREVSTQLRNTNGSILALIIAGATGIFGSLRDQFTAVKENEVASASRKTKKRS